MCSNYSAKLLRKGVWNIPGFVLSMKLYTIKSNARHAFIQTFGYVKLYPFTIAQFWYNSLFYLVKRDLQGWSNDHRARSFICRPLGSRTLMCTPVGYSISPLLYLFMWSVTQRSSKYKILLSLVWLGPRWIRPKTSRTQSEQSTYLAKKFLINKMARLCLYL